MYKKRKYTFFISSPKDKKNAVTGVTAFNIVEDPVIS